MTIFLILLVHLILHQTSQSYSGVFPREKLQIVNYHNYYRRNVQPTAANMYALKWDARLAEEGLYHVRKCRPEVAGNRYYGQNLYYSTMNLPTNRPIDVRQFIDRWANPYRKNKDDTSDIISLIAPSENSSISESNFPQHYTTYSQMVWAKTNFIGCAFQSYCPGMYKTIIVCNYYVSGNIQGQPWYQQGYPCSKCPYGTTCRNRLCVSSR